ncbi:AhpC/Tsa family protein GSU0066 [hydrothermal vent metagenome]|uniref:thioredoxin-dependent peroxiredoxin n=1 Tax=hydrothermal vent metagenome TaxID=652676 RepID=A0A3B0YAG4_9ZZZZ
MTLAQQIEKFNIEAAESIPSDVAEEFQSAIEEWVTTRIDKKALKVGQRMPSFQLNDANGKAVYSDELLKQGPIIISFYRGGWCPYCNLELKALQEKLNEFKDNNATLVAVSPELPDHSLSTIEKNELTFPVLTDRKLALAKQFGIVFKLPKNIENMTKNVFGLNLPEINGTDNFELPIPASYVVNSDHIIRHASVNPNFMQREEPSKIIDVLRNLSN